MTSATDPKVRLDSEKILLQNKKTAYANA